MFLPEAAPPSTKSPFISALQAINAFNKEKYEIIPIYITKQGRWFSGDALLEVKNYRDMAALQNMCAEVYMIPEYGDYNLYRKKSSPFREQYMGKTRRSHSRTARQ